MRILIAVAAFTIACGGTTGKKESSIVEGDVPQTCCCKTLPTTAEKEIVPVYTTTGRMECSSQHGDCVDEVQSNASGGDQSGGGDTGGGDGSPPPPPVLEPSTSGGIGEP
jgi:hypothetical protein